jgi:CHAT domain-containing protein
MRPVRDDESEVHAPLLLSHRVARWIERWDGYMRNRLPAGEIRTIAPRYKTASRRLPRAQTEADAIVARFGATRIGGTRAEVTALLESFNPGTVSLLHFAGHGVFSTTTAAESSIKLEDGELAASELARPEVRLGRLCRTLVFFNACEVGATGSIFGEVGGWADALLGRQFGGFIAPLWSVDDEDAGVVAAELLEAVVTRHEPIGEALRAARARHGDQSPTFYSYLYYGDVTARIGAEP